MSSNLGNLSTITDGVYFLLFINDSFEINR